VNQGLGSARDVVVSLDVSGAKEWEPCFQVRDGTVHIPTLIHPGQRIAVCSGEMLAWDSDLQGGTSSLNVLAVAYAPDSPRFELKAKPRQDDLQLYLPTLSEKAPPSMRFEPRPEWLRDVTPGDMAP